MYAKIKVTHGSDANYKYCKTSTENIKNIFGDVVKRVFTEHGEFARDDKVDKTGSWDSMNLLVEFSNGHYVSMNNSEWAGFHKEPKVEIS